MKAERISIDIEKNIIIGLIVNTNYLKRIYPMLNPDYFVVDACYNVAKWIKEYFEKYEQAPNKTIKDIFRRKRTELEEADAKWISKFLASLSELYEQDGINEKHLYEESVEYFSERDLLLRCERCQDLVSRNKIQEARTLLAKDSITEIDDTDLGIDPFDIDTIYRIKEEDNSERFYVYSGIESLDRMIGPLKSEWFILYMGPMKRGKTQALNHLAIISCMQGFDTVLINLESGYGDLAERVWMSVGSLVQAGKSKVVEYPYFKGEKIRYKKIKRKSIDNMQKLIKVSRSFKNVAKGRLRVKSFPAYTAGIPEINSYLNALKYRMNFMPKVIIIDYLGAMKAPNRTEGRDKYDINSKGLKAMSQDRNALVASAHQGSRETLEKLNMGITDVPEDIRILANVDVLFGLNQTDEEKEEGIMRISTMAHRFRRITRAKQIKLLHNPEVGQFALDDIITDTPKPVNAKGKLVNMK